MRSASPEKPNAVRPSAAISGASAEGRAPREGVSLVRAEMDLDDLDPAAWAYDSEETSTPGAPDHLR